MAIVTFDDAPPAKSGVVTFDEPPPKKIDTAAAGQKAVDEMTKNDSSGDINANIFGMPFTIPGNAIAGVGRFAVNAANGAKQLIYNNAQALESKFGNPFGTPSSTQAAQSNQADIDQARIDDKALLHTASGAIGNIAGGMLFTAPAFMAAGPTAIGAGIASAAAGALEPTSGDESRSLNMAKAAALGYGTQGIVNKAGDYILGKLAQRAAQKAQNAPIDATIQNAVDAGFAIPQSNTNPGLFTNRVEGVAGKIAMQQEASNNNSALFDAGSRREAGLQPNDPLTSPMLAARRAQAYEDGYDPIKQLGYIPHDATYASDLADIVQPHFEHLQSFPKSEPSPVIDAVNGYRDPNLTGSAALTAMGKLREQSKLAFRAGDNEMGRAKLDVSNAIESQIERHLGGLIGESTDPAEETTLKSILDNYRNARELMAKNKTVDDALIQGGGTVDPQSYARLIQSNSPMSDSKLPISGELKTMGEFANNFGKASQPYKKVSGYGVSKLDGVAAGTIATAGTALLGPVAGPALGAAALMGPPLLRKVLLSGPVQRATVPRNYNPSLIQQALSSEELAMAAGPTANALNENYGRR